MSTPSIPASEKLPLKEKIAYGTGGLSDFFLANVVGALAVPIFTLGYGMDPLLLGLALALPRVFAAVADALIGAMSDNCASRRGRRRPFIAIGALAGAVVMPLIWWCPRTGNAGMFAYVTFFGTLIAICQSLVAVPYGALGMELTPDYDERTRVIAWKSYAGVAGTLCAAWFYWFCQRKVFGGEITGARWLGVIGAGVVLAAGMITVVFCRERGGGPAARRARVPIFRALGMTLRNRPFLIILSAQLLLAFGTGVVGVLGSYVHIVYACGNNKELASLISGVGGSLTVLSNLLAIPLGLWLSTRLGKREAALCGLVILGFGLLLLPFTLRPAHPWLVIITWVIDAAGMPCAALMFGAMLPDICDMDELRTGLRREGAYSAVNSFLGRIVGISTMVAAGALPKLAGYADASLPPAGPVLERMRLMLIGIQIAVVLVSIVIVRRYPISRGQAARIRQEIEARREGVSPA
ncbi:MAG: MFS transporter [Opitutaceae bacterium]|jgi:GPH family glycoside/pentoside/hexuronide:cation symporter|nr:MFS transporter [Opitutaceae bacterium]